MIFIRDEQKNDISDISTLITSAFKNEPLSDKREAEIVELMRADSALSISLVAIKDGVVAGHISFSKVQIDHKFCG